MIHRFANILLFNKLLKATQLNTFTNVIKKQMKVHIITFGIDFIKESKVLLN